MASHFVGSRFRVVVVPLLLACLVPFSNARAGDDRTTGNGAEIFDHWCAPCHAPGPGHPGTQALAAKYKGSEPGPLLERKDLDPDIVKYTVRHGVSIMPFFRTTEITNEELDALALFVTAKDHK